MASSSYKIDIMLTLHDKMTRALEKIDSQAKRLESTTQRLNKATVSPTLKLNDRISGPLKTIEGKLKGLGTMAKVGIGKTLAGAGAFVKSSFSKAMDFESQMSSINASSAIEQFCGAMETLQISALLPTLPLIRDLALAMADLVEKYTPNITTAFQNATEKVRAFIESLSKNEAFQKMDWSDKIVLILDSIMKAMDGWVSGQGGQKVQEIFVKLAEIAVKAWMTVLKNLLKGGLQSLANGNIAGGVGQLFIANMLTGGLAGSAALAGGAILKKGGGAVLNKLTGKSVTSSAAEAVNAVSRTAQAGSKAPYTTKGYKAMDESMTIMRRAQVVKPVLRAVEPVGDSLSLLQKAMRATPADETLSMMAEAQNTAKAVTTPASGKVSWLSRAKSFFTRKPVMDEGLSIMREAQGKGYGFKMPSIFSPILNTANSSVSETNVPAAKAVITPANENASVLTKVAGRLTPVLKVAGKLAMPLEVAGEAIEVAKAKDKTRALIEGGAGLAGGWAGTELGAAIGTALLPGIGTVIGGLVGGVAGHFVAKKKAHENYDVARKPEKMNEAAQGAADKMGQIGQVWVDEQGRITTSNGFVINSQNDLMQSFTTLSQAVDFASAKLIAMSGIISAVASPGVGDFKIMEYGYVKGGILTRPHLGLVAEAGPEAIIPLSSRMRSRAPDLWQETGRQLGIRPYADGGFVGLIDNTQESSGGVNLNVQIPGISVQVGGSRDIDYDALAAEVGWRIVNPIIKTLENTA